MFGSDILEVAIGMAFLFLFMSTLASALREAIEAILKHRAVDLERGISEMLRTGNDKTLVADFYNHPLISSLYKGQYGEKGKGASLPAYIPKENFSLAILDLVAGSSGAGKLLSIDELKQTLKPKGNEQLNAVQRVILTTLSVADNDLAEVRKHLEGWYDGTMDRVTGWYARRSAAFLFAIGLGAAMLLNVDAITITKSLLVDKPLRQAVVAQAEKYVQGASAAQAPTEKPPAAAGDATPSESSSEKQKKSFDELRTEFAEIGYPIGWATSDDNSWYPAPQACKRVPATGGSADYKCDAKGDKYLGIMFVALLGWLITAIAIMLGAPFWFDLLNKLVSLRSSLKPPEAKPTRNKAKTNSAQANQANQDAPAN